MMIISDIIPIYKLSQYLNECIGSLMNQAFENIKFFLVNDGAIDFSKDICDIDNYSDKKMYKEMLSLIDKETDIAIRSHYMKYEKQIREKLQGNKNIMKLNKLYTIVIFFSYRFFNLCHKVISNISR